MATANDRVWDQAGKFHRLVPPLIGELSIVRHQVYWHSGSTHDRSWDYMFPSVADIEEITWKPGGIAKAPFKGCNFNSYQPNERMKYIYVWWRGILVHVRIQLHTEYVSILTSMNFSRNVEKRNSDIKGVRAYATAFRPQRKAIGETLRRLGTETPEGQSKTSELEALLGPLDARREDRSLFVEFDEDVNMRELRARVLASSAPDARDSGPEPIIDFRGLVTSAPLPDSADGTGERGTAKGRKPEARKELFRGCFEGVATPVRKDGLFLKEGEDITEETDLVAREGRSSWYLSEIGKYWRAVLPDAEVEDREDIEFSATGLLDGKAIFITHQAKPPRKREEEALASLSQSRFYLHCKRSDERQIGRVVDRLCTMATARAALERHAQQILEKRPQLRMVLGSIAKSRDGLILQNQILNRIILRQGDDEIGHVGKRNRAVARLRPGGRPTTRREAHVFGPQSSHELETELKARSAKANYDNENDSPVDYFSLAYKGEPLKAQSSRDVLRTLSNGMNALEYVIQRKLQFGSDGLGGPAQVDVWDADNYLEYKVDRAAYHFDRFTRLERQVRIARVEGSQTYPELVKRRMEDAFAFVRNAKDYLREIADQRTRMSDQIGNITQIVEAHESDEEQRKIAEIQDFAEFALLTFLLPYYLGSILKVSVAKVGWTSGEYEIFFWLIIAFTLINLIKRWVDGKLAGRFWMPPEKGLRRLGAIAAGINFLSIAAIVLAGWFLVQLRLSPPYAATDSTVSKGANGDPPAAVRSK